MLLGAPAIEREADGQRTCEICPQIVEHLIQIVVRLTQAAHCLQQRIIKGRIELTQFGQDAITQPIALKANVRIRFVRHKWLTNGRQPRFNLPPRYVEQRANDFLALIAHTDQAVQPTAARKMQEKSFDIILLMMRHGHGRQITLSQELVKPLVAQVARRHLHTHRL